jgi:cation diffusion facilitator CzcD-associated flavoprotein CzcO
MPNWVRTLFRLVPGAQRLYRNAIYWFLESRASGFNGRPMLMRLASKIALANMHRSVEDPELRRKLTPDYVMGCKRVLIANDYYPALTRPNVEVVTERITRVTPTSVVTADGAEHPVDTIIFGTGFRVAAGLGRSVPIIGRDGVALADDRRGGIEAFLGTTISGFPNLFVLTGPNTGLGHSSMIYMIESQLNYVVDALALLDEHGAAALDTRRDRQDDYNATIQRRLAGSVWNTGGCGSWYLDESGRNRTIWPGYTFRFRRRTRGVDLADHVLLGASGP